MKYVFVGDIHGKVEMVQAALERPGHKVFVGDFVDSYDRTHQDHADCLDLVLEAVKAGEADAIFGNHELSYLKPNKHRCSGYNDKTEVQMMERSKDLYTLFKPYLLLDGNVLVTHAGLHKQIWDEHGLSLKTLSPWLDGGWMGIRTSPVHWVGRARGGYDPVGGIFWCDWKTEFEPIPELVQIVGHTSRACKDGIVERDGNYCIDCLNYTKEFLELDIG